MTITKNQYRTGLLLLLLSLVNPVCLLAQAPVVAYATPQTYSVNAPVSPLGPFNTGGKVAVNGQTSTLVGSGLNQPSGAVVDQSGNIFISDAANNVIKKVTQAGVVTTFAGSGTAGATNSTGTLASFNHPAQLCMDASGNIYVADASNNMIRKITSGGVVTTLAGQTTAGFTDATGTAAKFNNPYGVALDASGNLFVADYNNNAIRKITSAGMVTTFAGSPTGASGSSNGIGSTATFNHPSGLAFNSSGTLLIADRLNNMIRGLSSSAVAYTVAGSTTAGSKDTILSAARFNLPTSLALDASGNIYVADYNNNEIRVIYLATVGTLAGSFDSPGLVNGPGVDAAFNHPFSLATDKNGNLYVCDYSNNALRKVAYAPYTLTPYLTAGLSFNSGNGVISGTPAVVASATNYTVNAYNTSGSSTATVNITIIAQAIPRGSPNQNYILTQEPRVSGLTTGTAIFNASTDNTQVQTQVQYFDGLGRPLQTVQVQASPTGKDVIQPFVYDSQSRDSVKYLPYTKSPVSPGGYQPTAVKGAAGTYSSSDQYTFYQQTGQGYVNTTYPYAATAFEPSSLDRPVEQGAPGTAWQLTGVSGGGHTVKTVYTLNNSTSFATDSVNGRQVAWYNATINSDSTRTLVANGYYPAGTLTVTISKDENWVSGRAGTVEEYKDLEGHVVLKRQYNYTTSLQVLSTYYVYDDYNLLAFVLPPASGADAAVTISKPTLDNLCYQYRYDDRGRMSQKKIPGKGWEFIIYNVVDQRVATQDSMQRTNKEWQFVKYDGLGRHIVTGIWDNGGKAISQTSLQIGLNAISNNLHEIPSSINNGYTNVAWPTTNVTSTLTIDYYDNYTNIPGLPSTYTLTNGVSQLTRGLQTAAKTAILNTPANQLWGIIYYDDLGRLTKSYAQNYLGGILNFANYDIFNITYNFTNQPTTLTRQHWNSANTTSALVTVANNYIYDQIGRKLKIWEQITNLNNTSTTKTLISKTDYNEIGQLWKKNLHSTDSTTYLQPVTYGYNERGWLLNSSANLFAMQLTYNTGAGTLQYNGNISLQYWGTSGSLSRNYNYQYDKLNRLLYGATIPAAGVYKETGIIYDQMGNLTGLQRYNAGTAIDVLSYTYTGNQLQSVYDNTGNNNGLVAGTTNYTYDGNGNMLRDTNSVNMAQNKTVTYNLLNLPQTVKVQHGMLTYTYDAVGNKLRKVSVISGVTHTTDYIAGIEYDGGTTDTLNFIQTEEGKAAKFGSIYDYQYYLSDHLGNTRVTFGTKTGSTVVYQSDDYYPFGLEINNSVTTPKNEYLYNKKELQEETQEYDYGLRFYNPLIGRFTTTDNCSEFFPSLTNYQYASNRPISGVDLNGLEFLPFGDFFLEDSSLIPRAVPIEELTRAGAEIRGEPIEEAIEEPVQKGKFEWHHLIPKALKDLPFIRNAIRGGFKFDGEENLIEQEKFSKATGEGTHGNHPQYSNNIEDQINKAAERYPDASPQKAAELLKQIATDARNLINDNPGVKINDLYKALLLFPGADAHDYYLNHSTAPAPQPKPKPNPKPKPPPKPKPKPTPPTPVPPTPVPTPPPVA